MKNELTSTLKTHIILLENPPSLCIASLIPAGKFFLKKDFEAINKLRNQRHGDRAITEIYSKILWEEHYRTAFTASVY